MKRVGKSELKEYNNRWFICGQHHARSGIQNLALDRIISLTISDSTFVGRPDFDPEVWFSDVLGVTKSSSDKPQRILFTATATHAPYIKTKPIHASQQLLEDYPDGSALFEITVIVNNELLRVLLAFGSGIKILEPDSLASQIKKILKEAVMQY